MVFNKKAYTKKHKKICKLAIPTKNNVKNCNKILNCKFDNCMQEIINLENTIPPIDEIHLCKKLPSIVKRRECLTKLYKKYENKDINAKFDNCIANKCPEYEDLKNKKIESDTKLKLSKDKTYICMTKKCKNELKLLDIGSDLKTYHECIKKHDNYNSQEKCLQKSYKKIEKKELPYYKCLEKNCPEKEDKKTIKKNTTNRNRNTT
jgi:hypothetical protein